MYVSKLNSLWGRCKVLPTGGGIITIFYVMLQGVLLRSSNDFISINHHRATKETPSIAICNQTWSYFVTKISILNQIMCSYRYIWIIWIENVSNSKCLKNSAPFKCGMRRLEPLVVIHRWWFHHRRVRSARATSTRE